MISDLRLETGSSQATRFRGKISAVIAWLCLSVCEASGKGRKELKK